MVVATSSSRRRGAASRVLVLHALGSFSGMCLATSDAAQAVELSIFGDQPVDLRGVAGLPASTQVALAQLGKPTWYRSDESGRSFEQIVTEQCGAHGPAVDNHLRVEMKRLNGVDSLDERPSAGTEVAVPFCLKVERNVKVRVAPGDTVESILAANYGIYGPKTTKQVYDLNKQRYGSESQEHFFKHLQAGMTIKIPYRSTVRTFEAKPTASGAAMLRDALDRLNRQMLRTLVIAASPSSTDPATSPSLEYVRFVTAEAAASVDPGCTATLDGAPFDADLVLERLSKELAGQPVNPALVGIIDTGISLVGDRFFQERFFRANERERDGREGKDDDRPENDFVDDVYGVNLNKDSDDGRILYYPHDPERDHGSKISALALGGLDFVESQSGPASTLVQLKIVNFSSSVEVGTVGAGELGAAITYLANQGADVINMSLATSRRFAGMLEPLRNEQGSAVFVVAAGNSDGGRGIDLGAAKVYPARFGGPMGEVSSRVVTVGAYNRNGAWAQLSNYSRDFVDLLAPGCAIETIDAAGQRSLEYGTSVSAAIVSFTAALIRGIGVKGPQNIKNRLLVGADVDDQLADRAWTSGRLNVVKSISIHHDVLELRDDPTNYV